MNVIKRKFCSQGSMQNGVVLFSLINYNELCTEEQKTFVRNAVWLGG